MEKSKDEQSVKGEIWTEDQLSDTPEQVEPDTDKVKKDQVDDEPSESSDDANAPTEEIKFQRIMDYRAYRRGMTINRVLITLACAVALSMLGFYSIFFGVVGALMALIIGTISVLVSIGNEQTYNIYNTRFVIKRRGEDKRKSVPFENIISVKYKSAFYEKRRCIGTVTINAKSGNGKIKKYKLKHIFDAKPIVEFFNQILSGRKGDGGQGRE